MSSFRSSLKSIADRLSSGDIESMSFMCEEIVPLSELEKVKNGIQLFSILQRLNKISEGDTDFLRKLLNSVGKEHLMKRLDDGETSNPRTVASQNAVGGPRIGRVSSGEDTAYKTLLVTIANGLTPFNVSEMVYLSADYLRGVQPKSRTALEFFTFLEQRNKLGPRYLHTLHVLLSEVKREDLAQKIANFVEKSGQTRSNDQTTPLPSAPPPMDPNLQYRGQSFVSTTSEEAAELQKRRYDFDDPIAALRQFHDPQSGPRPEDPFAGTPDAPKPARATTNTDDQSSKGLKMPQEATGDEQGGHKFLGLDGSMRPLKRLHVNEERGQPYNTNQPLDPPVAQPHQPSVNLDIQARHDTVSAKSEVGGVGADMYQGDAIIRGTEDMEVSSANNSEQIGEINDQLFQVASEMAKLKQDLEKESFEKEQEAQLRKRYEEHLLRLRSDKDDLLHQLQQLQSQQTKLPLVPESLRYRMDKNPHGLCLLINNYKFYSCDGDDPLPDRNGSHVDEHNLSFIFTSLNYQLMKYTNLTAQQIMQKMDEIKSSDHSNCDSFVCCILTHGKREGIYGADGRLCNISELAGLLRGSYCPTLKEKPKMFFIQACRGDDEDKGTPLQNDADGDTSLRHSLPNDADFLYAYSTAPGFVSWRSPTYGSWYVSKLCEVLHQRAKDGMDLLSMLTVVNDKVSQAYTKQGFKQCPAPVNMLRKQVVFL